MGNILFDQLPSELSLSGNPMVVKCVGKNAFTSIGTKFHGRLTISANHVVNSSMGLTWGENKVLLVCKTNPNFSGYQYPYNVGTSSPATVYFPYIQNNVKLVSDFIITLGSGYIDFEAREVGSQFNMTYDNGQPATFVVINAGTDKSVPSFYRLGFKIEVNGQFTYKSELPATEYTGDLIDPNHNFGFAETDIAEIFQKSVNGHFTFPVADQLSVTHSLVEQFRIYCYEIFGVPPLDNGGLFSGTLNYLQGKLSNFRQGQLNDLRKTFWNMLQETGMFLSFAPLVKTTDIYAPEKLYFLFAQTGNYKTRVIQYYSDDSVAVNDIETYVASKFDVRELIVSYDKIRTNAPKKVIKYEVFIVDSTNSVISEVRTFVLDYRYQKNARYFLFKNRIGVYELFRATGKATKKPKNEKEIVKIPLSNKFSQLDKEETQTNNTTTVTYTINTGYLTKEESDWIQELLDSEDVYWLKMSRAYPVTVQSNSRTASIDDDYNPYSEFDILHAIHDDYTEEFTANQPVNVGDFSADFSTDFFIGNVTPPPTIYYNVLLVLPFTRNNCSSNEVGSIVQYNVPAGKYSSLISQADADAKAQAEITANGQAYANANGTCSIVAPTYFYNVARSQVFTRNDCGTGTGSQVTYTVPASTYSSTVSQAKANALAEADIVANGQNYANSHGMCTWYNGIRSKTVAKNDCSIDKVGTSVTMQVAANIYLSHASQADADAQADAYLNLNAQANANAIGTCVLRDLVTVTIQNTNGKTCSIVFDAAGTSADKTILQNSSGTTLIKGISYNVTLNGSFSTCLFFNGEILMFSSSVGSTFSFTPTTNLQIVLV
jgi:hypothetical protein